MRTTWPYDVLNQWENGTWLGSCDWGDCDDEQIAWATCECNDAYCGKGNWLAICAECLAAGRSKKENHRVAESITFAELEAASSPTQPPSGGDA